MKEIDLGIMEEKNFSQAVKKIQHRQHWVDRNWNDKLYIRNLSNDCKKLYNLYFQAPNIGDPKIVTTGNKMSVDTLTVLGWYNQPALHVKIPYKITATKIVICLSDSEIEEISKQLSE